MPSQSALFMTLIPHDMRCLAGPELTQEARRTCYARTAVGPDLYRNILAYGGELAALCECSADPRLSLGHCLSTKLSRERVLATGEETWRAKWTVTIEDRGILHSASSGGV